MGASGEWKDEGFDEAPREDASLVERIAHASSDFAALGAEAAAELGI